jgi:hypothetical protein
MPPAVALTLPPGSASGIGSLPGTSALEAVPLPLTVLPGLPYLPELPARGVGADMVGRGLGMLVELHAEITPSGWRLADHPGRDARRAVSLLGEDLDALEERGQGYEGMLKLQVAGPWTLAANVELRYGDKALVDPGACRDIAASLADGLLAHVAEVRRRLPGLTGVVVQLDEPSLPAVLIGGVRTASGFGRLGAIEATVVERALQRIVELLAAQGVPTVVHCCAPDVPLGLLHRIGVAGVALDMSLVDSPVSEATRDAGGAAVDLALGELLEDGVVLFAGLVPSVDPPRHRQLSALAGTVAPVQALWRRLGLPPKTLATSVVPVPTCGLAKASPGYARTATVRCADAAHLLVELAEG